jgi:ubiquinone/menaquinone biosynthesis C-methylase UbiE
VNTETARGYSPEELAGIPEEANLGLGCGNPTALADLGPGMTVLDLGSGAGVDVFLAAQKVGPEGRAIGVDMTPDMIARAREIAASQGIGNAEFRLGEIEHLPVESGTVDRIISNCVINLAPDKSKVFAEAYRVLKPGGKLIVSDIVSQGEIPAEVRQNLEQWAGCVAGAMDRADYLETIRHCGFREVQVLHEETYDYGKTEEYALLSVTMEAAK